MADDGSEARAEIPRTQTDPKRAPWRRWRGEDVRAYGAFCIYRDLGAERSLTRAVRFYLSGVNDRSPRRRRQSRKFSNHPAPGKYLHRVRRTWGEWSRLNFWVSRCEQYDEFIRAEAEERAKQTAVEAAIADGEELDAERRRQIEAGRKAVRAGTAVVQRIVDLYEAGAFEQLTLDRMRLRPKDGPAGEIERRSITDLLIGALAAITEGQRIQRIAQEQATEKREVRLDLSGLDRLADVIIEKVPAKDREWVLDQIAAIMREERDRSARDGG